MGLVMVTRWIVGLLLAFGAIGAAPATAAPGIPLSVCVARAAPGAIASRGFASTARFDCTTRQSRLGKGDFLVRSQLLPRLPTGTDLTIRFASMWQDRVTVYVRYADGALFDVQDDWNALPGAKLPKIEAHFRKAVQQPGKLFVNYVSTSASLPPRWNSDYLNPRVHSFVDGAEASGWKGLGIVAMDYPATRPGLVDSLLRHNEGMPGRPGAGLART